MNQSVAGNAEPPFGLFEIVKGFYSHATVHRDSLTKSFRIKHRFQQHIGKARHRDSVAVNTLGHRVRHVLAVIKTLERFRISDDLAAIYQHLFQFVLRKRGENVMKRLLRLRKVPGSRVHYVKEVSIMISL